MFWFENCIWNNIILPDPDPQSPDLVLDKLNPDRDTGDPE